MSTASRAAVEAEREAPDAASGRESGPLDAHAGPAAAPLVWAKRRPRRPGVLSADPLAEAGRKILRLHFEEMLAHESGTLAGEDPEALHDMRVATRRQRAALRLVASHFRRMAIRPVRAGLRALGGVLGAVRDLDVLLARALAEGSPPADEGSRIPPVLVDSWRRRRDAARAQMRVHLEGTGYREFREEYARFLDTPGAGTRAAAPGEAPRPTLVAHVVPVEIWERYGAVCAFGTVLPWASVEMLHALRIEAKGLRYVLEFFREVLDPCVEEAIGAIVALQDHLGELQDAVVAIALVRDFLAGPEAAASPGVAAVAGRYLESRQAAVEGLRRSVDRPWGEVSGAAFRSCLARAAAAP